MYMVLLLYKDILILLLQCIFAVTDEQIDCLVAICYLSNTIKRIIKNIYTFRSHLFGKYPQDYSIICLFVCICIMIINMEK